MAEAVPARLTPREGRKFAFVVGGAFLLIAAISLWRGHVWPPRIFGAIGGLLVVSGLLVPGRLGPIYRGWMGFAHALSKVTTPIFLGVVYFLVMMPIGLLRRLFGRNPLRHQGENDSYWLYPPSGGRSDLTTQF
ncbi:MAG: SxtJ family membrane protein [Gemmatimonadales bacterium]